MSIWGFGRDAEERREGERDYDRYRRPDPWRSRYDGKSDEYFRGYDAAEREEREAEEAAERRREERRRQERREEQEYEAYSEECEH